MGRFLIILTVSCLFITQTDFVGADEKTIDQLPGDVADIATVWTEPIKQVHKRSKQFDPISSLWLGLIEGSVKSIERVISMVLSQKDQPHAPPRKPGETFRYTF